jgi:hypothetical protein
MKFLNVLAAAVMVLAVIVLGFAVSPASAHRSGCHTQHTCPSDHGTYRWHGLRCVKPTASERNSTFKKRAVYDRLVYDCKR